MANLQVRDLDDRLYNSLKLKAKMENRSISQEVIYILEKYLSNPSEYNNCTTKEFLSLCNAWDDDKDADEIINNIKKDRKNSERFDNVNVLFD